MLTLLGCYSPQPAAGTPQTLAASHLYWYHHNLHAVLVVLSLLGQRGGVTLPGLILLSASLRERRP